MTDHLCTPSHTENRRRVDACSVALQDATTERRDTDDGPHVPHRVRAPDGRGMGPRGGPLGRQVPGTEVRADYLNAVSGPDIGPQCEEPECRRIIFGTGSLRCVVHRQHQHVSRLGFPSGYALSNPDDEPPWIHDAREIREAQQ